MNNIEHNQLLTIPEMVKEIQKISPNKHITESTLRRLYKEKLIVPTIDFANGPLFNFADVYNFLFADYQPHFSSQEIVDRLSKKNLYNASKSSAVQSGSRSKKNKTSVASVDPKIKSVWTEVN